MNFIANSLALVLAIFYSSTLYSQEQQAAVNLLTDSDTVDLVLLRNGDQKVGKLKNASFSFSTAFGKIQLKLSQLSSLHIHQDSTKKDRAVMKNSDSISGNFDGFKLELVTESGNILAIGQAQVESISFHIPKEKFASNAKSHTKSKIKPGAESGFDGIQFVFIPPGEFSMGSTRREIGHHGDEGPIRKVEISRGFWLSKFEVTQAQWKSVVLANPSRFMNCPECPVEQVSWNDAWQFVDILNNKNGCLKSLTAEQGGIDSIRGALDKTELEGIPSGCYRLPTEAEWEYAARADTNTAYSFDSTSRVNDHAWQVTNARGRTYPVGQKKPNPWGLHDIYGNVWEWVYDRYADSYSGAKTENPKGPLHGQHRVGRGGGFNLTGGFCRSASRHWSAPDVRYCYIGFRLLRTL
ncbi:formylglycine-generating enzyme family protein [bacterium]|nr:formylglycine-generating enzyme family protein [bacterium]